VNRRAIAGCDNFVRAAPPIMRSAPAPPSSRLLPALPVVKKCIGRSWQTAPNVVARISVLGLAIDVVADQRSVLRYAMTSSISPDVSRNSGMVGWIPSAKGRCRSATPCLRPKLRNGGAFAKRLALTLSMA
jgi:hypothetical protein